MKKSLIAVALSLIILFAFSPVMAESEKEPIHLGAIFSTIGPLAELGQECMHVVDVAEDFINERGGIRGYPIKLTVYEGETDPSLFASRSHRLIESDEVVAGFGGTDLALSTAAGEVFQANEIPYINTAGSTPTITLVGDYVFSSVQPDNDQGRASAKYFYEELGYETYAIFKDVAQEYTTNMTEYFIFYAKEFIGKEDPAPIVLTFETGEGDFSGHITRLLRDMQAEGIEAIYLPTFPGDAPEIALQLSDLGIDLPLLGACGIDSYTLGEVGGEAVEGLILSTHYVPGQPMSEIAMEFEEVYMQHYEGDERLYRPGGHGMMALESLLQYKEAIGAVIDDKGSDWWDNAEKEEQSKAIRDSLATIEFSNTTTPNPYSFDDVGRPQMGVPMAIVEDGEIVYYDYMEYDEFTPEGIELFPLMR